VDAQMKSTNRKVYAIGDAAGGLQFTHVAGYHAGVIIRSALFGMPSKASHHHIPWVTYTDPELAQVGLTGATIVGVQAGELIQTWALALSAKLKISDIAGMVAAYPTMGEINKRAAGQYYVPRLFQSETIKRVVRFVQRF